MHYNIVELFSGIGSQVRALENIGIRTTVKAICEWDIHAFIAYDAIHEDYHNIPEAEKMSKEELYDKLKGYTLSNNGKDAMSASTLHAYSEAVLRRIYSAIKRNHNLVDISTTTGDQIPDDTDIMTYSFPCQDLSNVGAFHGYNKGIDKESGSRSSLLWQVGRILTEMQGIGRHLPRFLVMENVPTLLSPRHISNFKKWIEDLEVLGYISKYVHVNARNYGIPQNRPRLLMISVLVNGDKSIEEKIRKYFDILDEQKIIKDYRKSRYYHLLTIRDLLRIPENEGDAYWDEAVECTPNNTQSRLRIWNENPKIIDENGNLTTDAFIRTITTKQDRNPNSGNIHFDSGIAGRGTFRYLTPRECLLFMGFTDEDYEKIVANNPEQRVRSCLFPRDKIIRMAGNSIPVKMLEGFFYQFYKIEALLKEKK